MDLSNLKPAFGSTKTRKRVGRGSGSGLGGTGVGVVALLLSEEKFKVFFGAEVCRTGRT